MDLGKVANLLSDSLFVSLEEVTEPEGVYRMLIFTNRRKN